MIIILWRIKIIRYNTEVFYIISYLVETIKFDWSENVVRGYWEIVNSLYSFGSLTITNGLNI